MMEKTTGTGRAKKKTTKAPTRKRAAAPRSPRKSAAPARADRETMAWAEPTHEEISKRAYELYLARGGRDAGPDDDWLRAEQELRAARVRTRKGHLGNA